MACISQWISAGSQNTPRNNSGVPGSIRPLPREHAIPAWEQFCSWERDDLSQESATAKGGDSREDQKPTLVRLAVFLSSGPRTGTVNGNAQPVSLIYLGNRAELPSHQRPAIIV